MTEIDKPKKFNLAQIIFISLMASVNVGLDLLVSPAFIALTTHVIAGLLIMVPFNYLFISLTRFSVNKSQIEKYRRRYLPSRNMGTVIISTNKGLLTHEEAQEEEIGGCLIAYFY